jgi:hypothetical protein
MAADLAIENCSSSDELSLLVQQACSGQLEPLAEATQRALAVQEQMQQLHHTAAALIEIERTQRRSRCWAQRRGAMWYLLRLQLLWGYC